MDTFDTLERNLRRLSLAFEGFWNNNFQEDRVLNPPFDVALFTVTEFPKSDHAVELHHNDTLISR